jgi:hypothetical protein
MSKILLVRRDQRVNQGDVIGRVEALDLRLGHMYVIVLEKTITSRCA